MESERRGREGRSETGNVSGPDQVQEKIDAPGLLMSIMFPV